jgi:uncharacterized protein (TIGR02246 family)
MKVGNLTEDARSRIEAANRAWMNAFKRHDATGVAALYTKQAQLLPAHSTSVKGTEAIRSFYQRVFDNGMKEAVLEILDLEVHGDTAIETGQFTLLVDGGLLADKGKYVVIWKKSDGAWKLDRDIWTTSQPRGPLRG